MEIEVNNQQRLVAVDGPQLVAAVRAVLSEAGVRAGEISIAVVDDAHMRRLNAQYLHHDWPTDVLSFVIETAGDTLDGQLILSAETAARAAPQFGWSAGEELLLYAIHGALHLVAYDDHSDEDRARMRAAERRHLAAFGARPTITPPPRDQP